jgi:hypothetical protein
MPPRCVDVGLCTVYFRTMHFPGSTAHFYPVGRNRPKSPDRQGNRPFWMVFPPKSAVLRRRPMHFERCIFPEVRHNAQFYPVGRNRPKSPDRQGNRPFWMVLASGSLPRKEVRAFPLAVASGATTRSLSFSRGPTTRGRSRCYARCLFLFTASQCYQLSRLFLLQRADPSSGE